jgi:hypothetical protein
MDNKYRQFIGILNGLNRLTEMDNFDYIVKIRTYQFFDLNRIIEEFVELKRLKKEDFIGVPFIREPIEISDYFFISSIDMMEFLCKSMLDYNMFEFAKSVHHDIPFKCAYHKLNEKLPEHAFFPRKKSFNFFYNKYIYNYLLSKLFIPLDKEIMENTIWRGEKHQEILNDEVFLTNKNHKKNPPLSKNISKASVKNFIDKFVKTDWLKYTDFIKNAKDNQLTFSENINAYVYNKFKK